MTPSLPLRILGWALVLAWASLIYAPLTALIEAAE